jgi:hypothetical protein
MRAVALFEPFGERDVSCGPIRLRQFAQEYPNRLLRSTEGLDDSPVDCVNQRTELHSVAPFGETDLNKRHGSSKRFRTSRSLHSYFDSDRVEAAKAEHNRVSRCHRHGIGQAAGEHNPAAGDVKAAGCQLVGRERQR